MPNWIYNISLQVQSYQDGFGIRHLSNQLAFGECAQHSVHPTGGSLRVFKQFVRLEAGSGKAAFSRPAHQRVTPTVGRLVGLPRKGLAITFHRQCFVLHNLSSELIRENDASL
jgi:hypothetical protein